MNLLDHNGNLFKNKMTGLYSWMKTSYASIPTGLQALFDENPCTVTTNLTMPQDDDNAFDYPHYHEDSTPIIYTEVPTEEDDTYYYCGGGEGPIVFSDGEWHLSKNAPEPDVSWAPANKDMTHIWHYCEDRRWRHYPDGDHLMAYGTCDECNKPVPDSVLTVWKLQNMEWLPTGELWSPHLTESSGAPFHIPEHCDDPFCLCYEESQSGSGPIISVAAKPLDPGDIIMTSTEPDHDLLTDW
jgi:hypothetical protein